MVIKQWYNVENRCSWALTFKTYLRYLGYIHHMTSGDGCTLEGINQFVKSFINGWHAKSFFQFEQLCHLLCNREIKYIHKGWLGCLLYLELLIAFKHFCYKTQQTWPMSEKFKCYYHSLNEIQLCGIINGAFINCNDSCEHTTICFVCILEINEWLESNLSFLKT